MLLGEQEGREPRQKKRTGHKGPRRVDSTASQRKIVGKVLSQDTLAGMHTDAEEPSRESWCPSCKEPMPAGNGTCASCGMEKKVVVLNSQVSVSESQSGLREGPIRRGKKSGKKRPSHETAFGHVRYKQSYRIVWRFYLRDRDKDLRLEVLIDPATGKELYRSEGRLSEHR